MMSNQSIMTMYWIVTQRSSTGMRVRRRLGLLYLPFGAFRGCFFGFAFNAFSAAKG